MHVCRAKLAVCSTAGFPEFRDKSAPPGLTRRKSAPWPRYGFVAAVCALLLFITHARMTTYLLRQDTYPRAVLAANRVDAMLYPDYPVRLEPASPRPC